MIQALTDLIRMSGLAHLTYKEIIMIIIACIFLYLAIKKGYEPYLLIPIAFGILLVNLPLAGLMTPPTESEPGGLIYYLYQGTNLGIYPPLIFLCLGAATDFGPLIANPKTLLLGGAAQFIVTGMMSERAFSPFLTCRPSSFHRLKLAIGAKGKPRSPS